MNKMNVVLHINISKNTTQPS
uniref:Uncharacterized protein n=1 Tax=Anguilla anguilla TaxID=7936 RepID=A0A0E9W405_ANGAN